MSKASVAFVCLAYVARGGSLKATRELVRDSVEREREEALDSRPLALLLATGSAPAFTVHARAPFSKPVGAQRPRAAHAENKAAELRLQPSPVMKPAQDEEEYASGLEVLTQRPTRAAMALAWLAFSVYAAAFSPGEFGSAEDLELVKDLFLNEGVRGNAVFYVIFNSLGVIPAINAALLLPGAKDQKPIPAAPFVAGSFVAGFGAVGPYMALREPRPQAATKADLGFFARNVTENKFFGLGLLVAGALLYYKIVTAGTVFQFEEYARLFATSKVVHVSTIDFFVLTAFMYELIREDMFRRRIFKTDNEFLAGYWLFSLVPVIGPAAYLFSRPPLPDE